MWLSGPEATDNFSIITTVSCCAGNRLAALAPWRPIGSANCQVPRSHPMLLYTCAPTAHSLLPLLVLCLALLAQTLPSHAFPVGGLVVILPSSILAAPMSIHAHTAFTASSSWMPSLLAVFLMAAHVVPPSIWTQSHVKVNFVDAFPYANLSNCARKRRACKLCGCASDCLQCRCFYAWRTD